MSTLSPVPTARSEQAAIKRQSEVQLAQTEAKLKQDKEKKMKEEAARMTKMREEAKAKKAARPKTPPKPPTPPPKGCLFYYTVLYKLIIQSRHQNPNQSSHQRQNHRRHHPRPSGSHLAIMLITVGSRRFATIAPSILSKLERSMIFCPR